MIRLAVVTPTGKVKVLAEALDDPQFISLFVKIRNSLNEQTLLVNADKGHRAVVLNEDGTDGPWSEEEI